MTDDDRSSPGGIVDSFSMVSLKIFLEKKYEIKIPDEKATPEAFDTVENIMNLVEAVHRQMLSEEESHGIQPTRRKRSSRTS